MSENLFKSIYALYIATPANTFYTATSGRLEYYRAPESWTDNFAVMQATSINADDMFRQAVDDLYFQVNVFSSTRATCWSLLEKCKALLHNATLTVTGHYPVLLRRENQVPPMWNEQDNLWQATIEFRLKLQAT